MARLRSIFASLLAAMLVLQLLPINAKKHKGIRLGKVKIKKMHLPSAHKHKHHAKAPAPAYKQSAIPRYSPPFHGPDTGVLPTDDQVALIGSWLSTVQMTLDVFLRTASMQVDDEDAQRQVIMNTYPPVRILLEALYAHEAKDELVPSASPTPTPTIAAPTTSTAAASETTAASAAPKKKKKKKAKKPKKIKTKKPKKIKLKKRHKK
jgi:hypothetical protein